MSPPPGIAPPTDQPTPSPIATQPAWLWWLSALGVVVAAALVGSSHRHELAQITRLIAQVDALRLVLALALEAGSLVCFAAMQRWLLAAAGVRPSLPSMTAVVMAANAVAGALPGGTAFSTVWLFRQFRRRGAEAPLAAAVLIVAGALSIASLLLLLLLGALTAGLIGGGALLRPALAGVALVTGGALVVLALRRSQALRALAQRAWTRAGRHFRHVQQLEEALSHLVEQTRSLKPGLRPWLRPAGLALSNWVLDAACLAAALWALGIAVPWHGLLFAYCLTQISGSLRLTPGSIGIVETSLSALLVLYGLPANHAIAGTLLYRICSFWILQPIGWSCWVTLNVRSRHPETD